MSTIIDRRRKEFDEGRPVSSTWEELKKVRSNCGNFISEEMMCDLLRGPEDEECQKLFLQNEDCYQRTLCHERWKDALHCLRTKPHETCERYVTRSRNCKDDYFRQLLSPPLKEYLQNEARINVECEELQIRHANCLAVFGQYEKECLDREYILNQCILGKSVPKHQWKEWKICEKSLKETDEPNEACFDELENIRAVLFERSKLVALSVPGVDFSSFKETGGPDGTLEFLSKIYYGSHYGNIFKSFDPRPNSTSISKHDEKS